jgi:hypothetical protein
MLPKTLVPPAVCVVLSLAGCDFLWDVIQPDAPALPATPTICFADDLEFTGEPTTLDLRFDNVALAGPLGISPTFAACVGDGETWELVDGDGLHLWLGISGASAGVVDGINAAFGFGLPLSLHIASTRDAGPGTDIFALTFADAGIPAVAFQRNGDIALADAGVMSVDAGGIPVVSSDECGLFEFPELLFVGGDEDLLDEAAEPDPETGALPVLVPGQVILTMGEQGAVFVNGEVVDVFAGVVFARAAADCPDPPPTGRFMNWTALLRF